MGPGTCPDAGLDLTGSSHSSRRVQGLWLARPIESDLVWKRPLACPIESDLVQKTPSKTSSQVLGRVGFSRTFYLLTFFHGHSILHDRLLNEREKKWHRDGIGMRLANEIFWRHTRLRLVTSGLISFLPVTSASRVTRTRFVSCVLLTSPLTLCKNFSSRRASSRCLPSFASRRRLLGLRQRSFRTQDCRSGVDLGAKKFYKKMLAKKWRLDTNEDTLVRRLNVQTNFQERRRAQAGSLTGYIAMRSLPDGSISGHLRKRHGKFFHSGFLLFLKQQRKQEYYSLTKNPERITLSSNTRDRQRARVKRKKVYKSNGVTRWRELESTYCVRSISARNTDTWAFFRTPFFFFASIYFTRMAR